MASVLYLSREWEWQGRPRPSGVGATLLRGPGGAVCVCVRVSLFSSLPSLTPLLRECVLSVESLCVLCVWRGLCVTRPTDEPVAPAFWR